MSLFTLVNVCLKTTFIWWSIDAKEILYLPLRIKYQSFLCSIIYVLFFMFRKWRWRNLCNIILETVSELFKWFHSWQGSSSQWVDVMKKKREVHEHIINQVQQKSSADKEVKVIFWGLDTMLHTLRSTVYTTGSYQIGTVINALCSL